MTRDNYATAQAGQSRQDATPSPQMVGGLSLVDRYRPSEGRWDELVDTERVVRPAFGGVASFLESLGPLGLRQRAEQVRQLVRDHGVSFSLPGDTQAGERIWHLDPVPAPFDAESFVELSQGLVQRAQLFEAILQDLHGPQRVLREGLIPAELVLANPAFLRPCHGVKIERFLQLYAVDLARAPSGEFLVLRDRTQAPTGAGYALENRLVMGQVFEEPFRACNALRLAPFFRTLRETLAALAPVSRESPSIVLQSSGSYSPTYFEQAFLAQYLGYPLVEGGDLTVRDRRVFLKTLGGLHPVDVIFRQPQDDYCDPLELRPESSLGVPGLLEAVRAGQVAVANALGAGLLQSPVFLPFLPALCQVLLGAPLKLNTASTYWCGDPRSLSHVVANLTRMVFRPVWPNGEASLTFGAVLSGAAREAFLAHLRAQPARFVAQEQVSLGHAPILAGTELTSRPWVLRAYAVADGEGYSVMPGGLALAAAQRDEEVIAVASGALAKDVWVGSQAPVVHDSLLPPATRPVELSRAGADLPSRSADNLFWLGRYAERAESLARLSRHLLGRLAEEGDAASAASPALPILVQVLAETTESVVTPEERTQLWLARTLCSTDASGSLHNTVRAAVRSAAAVRERLSLDTFRVLGALGEEVRAAESLATSRSPGTLTAFLDRMVVSLSALSGLAMESMTRGHGWRFLDMGRRLERALQLLHLLVAAFTAGAEREGELLETLLRVADSSITYRRRYLAGLHAAAVVDLLLVDDTNPRSVLFQVAALREHLMQLPRDSTQPRMRGEERLALAALTRLQLLDVGPACQSAGVGKRPPLLAVLVDLETELLELSNQLCGGYLSHALLARPLAVEPPRGGST